MVAMSIAEQGGHEGFYVLDQKSSKRFLDDVETLLFDCDGVLWKGSSLISGADKVRRYNACMRSPTMHVAMYQFTDIDRTWTMNAGPS